ncbi:hypothetical protein [Parapedobacter sp.]
MVTVNNGLANNISESYSSSTKSKTFKRNIQILARRNRFCPHGKANFKYFEIKKAGNWGFHPTFAVYQQMPAEVFVFIMLGNIRPYFCHYKLPINSKALEGFAHRYGQMDVLVEAYEHIG